MKIAIIKSGGKQYIVKEGDKLKLEKVAKEAGDKMAINEVLFISDTDDASKTVIGNPYIANAVVEGLIKEQGLNKKIDIIKFKSKTRYRRKMGYRHPYTLLQVEKITS